MTVMRWTRAVVGGLAVLAGVGAVYQAIAAQRDKSKCQPPGRLVDVGGHRLHINVMGQGTPAVVMDSGLSHSSLAWGWVQPKVAKFTRVCTYDRAGYGWSDPGPKPRTSQRISDELDRLLVNAGIDAPYIMVGHSSGGLNVRLYAIQHPEKVVGMVLVDAAHENQLERLPRRFLTYPSQCSPHTSLMPEGGCRRMTQIKAGWPCRQTWRVWCRTAPT
jgi:pimeloyl-ACP methyl ester carboxylesterase